MSSARILVIEDEPAVRQIIAAQVKQAGYDVDQADSMSIAAAKLVRGDIDVALCDIQMPDGNGIELVRSIRSGNIDTAFIMVTAMASMETVVEALRAGAADFISKPLRSEELLHRLAQVVSMRGLRKENSVLRKVMVDTSPRLFHFSSPSMVAVERLVSRVAPSTSTVLITGESGTGKGVVARDIHTLSGRTGGAFVPVNCAAIPETLMESELFGHVRGAFTGADRARKGLFLEGDGGTLFLDEIGELPLHMQTKLLHVIEEKEVRPVGSEQSRRIDVRIIVATNRDLQKMVSEGKFREDLYFRVSMFHIQIPSLRERKEDMSGLIRHILDGYKVQNGSGQAPDIDAAAEELLLSYAWPGNVREMENVLNRAQLMADGDRITLADIPPQISRISNATMPPAYPSNRADATQDVTGSLRNQLRQFEARAIMRAISAANGDRRLAAQHLEIGLSSLYRKLEEFSDLAEPKGSV